jgi:hypothetical protein
MTPPIECLRATSWARRLVLACAAAALVLCFRLWIGSGWADPRVYVVQLGLASAWGASAAALLLAGLALLERLQRRPRGLASSSLPWQVATWAGASIALAMAVQLTLEFSEDQLVYGLLAAVITVLAWRRREQRVVTLPAILVPCAFVVVSVQVPREHGLYSLSWSRWTSNASWSWQGSQDCKGVAVADRPTTIAAYRPQPVIVPAIGGSLGELVSKKLGRPPFDELLRPDIVTIDVRGKLDHGDLPCYLPMVSSDTMRGTLHVDAQFVTQGRGDEIWSLQCSDSRTLSFTIDVSSTGISSCRDLGNAAAQSIAEQIRTHARTLSGHAP